MMEGGRKMMDLGSDGSMEWLEGVEQHDCWSVLDFERWYRDPSPSSYACRGWFCFVSTHEVDPLIISDMLDVDEWRVLYQAALSVNVDDDTLRRKWVEVKFSLWRQLWIDELCTSR